MDNDTTIFHDIRKAYLLAVGNLDVRHERIINEREHEERLKKVEKEQKKRQRQQDQKRALAKKTANGRLLSRSKKKIQLRLLWVLGRKSAGGTKPIDPQGGLWAC
jgi:hypothetical protein